MHVRFKLEKYSIYSTIPYVKKDEVAYTLAWKTLVRLL